VQILYHVIIINILIYIKKEKMIKHRDGVMAGSEKKFGSFTFYHFTFADYIQISSEPHSE